MPKQPEPQKDKPTTRRQYKLHRRGVAVYYDEKKQSVNLSLTPSAIAQLKYLAETQGSSRSEVIERWLREQMQ